jgi:hypothetical protein
MAGDDFEAGGMIHLFSPDVDLSGNHPIRIPQRIQEGFPGIISRSNDLGGFF